VIEICSCPVRRGVALVARLRDPCLSVIRVIGIVEVVEVAAYASGVLDAVVIVDVAGFATDGCVHPSQGPTLGRVTEVDVSPLGGVVAHSAGGRLAGLRVIRCRRRHVILLMAREAIGGRPDELAVDMALRTRDVYVPAR